MSLDDCLNDLPLIAILRGLRAEEAPAVGDALIEAGFRLLEVPLNSPEPFKSLRLLAERHGERALVGAGTVISASDVGRVADAGGRLIVMPHGDPVVIREAKRQGLICTPGVATPTEAFAALYAGADALKLFPAEALPPAVVKAWRAVMPREIGLYPVGGIAPGTMAAYWQAGASGFGLGSALFTPALAPDQVAANARAFAEAFAALDAGVDALKLFPAEALPPVVVKAWLAVLPKGTRLVPVGGITPDNMAPYIAAGAAGFGLGSALYKAGQEVAEVGANARTFVAAWRNRA
jgi:2-dehydro-3-deoxyphosphogalactonate aldolase